MRLCLFFLFWKTWPKMVCWIEIRIAYQTRYARQNIHCYSFSVFVLTLLMFCSHPQCRARATAAITGVGSYIAHSYFNYQYYAQFAFGTKEDNYTSTTPNSNTNILAIRNEHIVEDWNKINILLEGHYGVLQSSDVPRNNVSSNDCELITVLVC